MMTTSVNEGKGGDKMIGDDKIVDFEQWCPECLYFGYDEADEPCHECLGEPVNADSHKPTKFRPAKKEKNR